MISMLCYDMYVSMLCYAAMHILYDVWVCYAMLQHGMFCYVMYGNFFYYVKPCTQCTFCMSHMICMSYKSYAFCNDMFCVAIFAIYVMYLPYFCMLWMSYLC